MDKLALEDGTTAEIFDGVSLTQLVAGDEMSLQHYRIEPGAVVERHDHPHEQAGYLMTGTLTWQIDGETIETEAGEAYVIPGDEAHRVENRGTEAAIGVELFSPPRPNPPWLED